MLKFKERDNLKNIEIDDYAENIVNFNIDKFDHTHDILFIILYFVFIFCNFVLAYFIKIEGGEIVQQELFYPNGYDNISSFYVSVQDILPRHKFAKLRAQFTFHDPNSITKTNLTIHSKIIGIKGTKQSRFNYTKTVRLDNSLKSLKHNNSVSDNFVIFENYNMIYSTFVSTINIIGDYSNLTSVIFTWNFASNEYILNETFQRITNTILILLALYIFNSKIKEEKKKDPRRRNHIEQTLTVYLVYASLLYNNVFVLLTNKKPTKILMIIDCCFRSIFNSFVLFYTFTILQKQGLKQSNQSNTKSKMPLYASSFFFVVSFAQLLVKQMKKFDWSPDNAYDHLSLEYVVQALTSISLITVFVVFSTIFVAAQDQVESSEVFKVNTYILVFIFIFISLLFDLSIFPESKKAYATIIPLSMNTAFTLLMLYFHYPFDITENNEYINPEDVNDNYDNALFEEGDELDEIQETEKDTQK